MNSWQVALVSFATHVPAPDGRLAEDFDERTANVSADESPGGHTKRHGERTVSGFPPSLRPWLDSGFLLRA